MGNKATNPLWICFLWWKQSCPIHLKEFSSIMQMVCEMHSVEESDVVICFLRRSLQCEGYLRSRHIMFPGSWHPCNINGISGSCAEEAVGKKIRNENNNVLSLQTLSYWGSLAGAGVFPSMQWAESRKTLDWLLIHHRDNRLTHLQYAVFNSPASCPANYAIINVRSGSYCCVCCVVKLSVSSLGNPLTALCIIYMDNLTRWRNPFSIFHQKAWRNRMFAQCECSKLQRPHRVCLCHPV